MSIDNGVIRAALLYRAALITPKKGLDKKELMCYNEDGKECA